MKKISTVLTVLFLAVALNAATSSSVINAPAATVNLIRNKVITTTELDQAIQAQGATSAQALDILNVLINNEVFLQGAERDGVKVSDAQAEQLYQSQKSYIEQTNGITISDEEFKNQAIREYGSVETYKRILKEQYILQTYLMQEKGSEMQNKVKQPTDTEIRAFYRKNATSFVSPENARISQIFIAKSTDAAKNSSNKAKLEAAVRDIKSGKITFESGVKQYSEDKSSKDIGGDIGYLTSNNEEALEFLGQDFCDAVLALDDGQVSGVIESKQGYHIIRCVVHSDPKVLSIDDRISPEENTTVYQYIQSGLYYQNQQSVMAECLNEMIESLKKDARIKILYK